MPSGMSIVSPWINEIFPKNRHTTCKSIGILSLKFYIERAAARLPDAALPKRRHQQGQDGKDFQPPHEHGQAHDGLAERGHIRIGTRRPKQAEARPAAAHRRDGYAQSVKNGNAVEDQQHGPQYVQHDIYEEKTGYAVQYVFGKVLSIGADVQDEMRVHLLPYAQNDRLDQQHEARHLQPAGCRAGAASDKDEKDQDKLGKGRPFVEITGNKSRRRR